MFGANVNMAVGKRLKLVRTRAVVFGLCALSPQVVHGGTARGHI